jgi:Tfp pilus assembly protein PilX
MFCPQCGKPLADGARFCGNCGASLGAAASGAGTAGSPAAGAGMPGATSATGSAASSTSGSAASSFPGGATSARADAPRIDPPPRPDYGASPGAVPPLGATADGLVGRVKRILLSPKTEWPVIAAEPKTARDIYVGYVAPLALIGVIASLIGTTMIGVSVPLLGTIRTPLVPALVGAILHFALTFVGVFVIALIVDALAPTFGGQKDSLRALKVTAYSFTASWVAAIVTIIPMLGIIAVIAGLYGLYLLYLGLPVLMRNPEDKSVGYTVVIVICAIVLMFIIGIVSTALIGLFGMGSANVLGRAATQHQSADAAAAAAVSKMLGGQTPEDQARMEKAMSTLQKMGEQADKSAKSGQGAGAVDMAAAMNAVGTMMAGGKDVKPVDFHELKEMLPASLPGFTRTEASGQSGEAMGMKGSSATANYSDGAKAALTIEIADLGSLSGLASLATRFDPKMEKETSTGYERTRTISGQLVHEQYDRQAKRGETTVMVGNRFSVTVRGHDVEPAQLTGALQALDLGRLPKLAAK